MNSNIDAVTVLLLLFLLHLGGFTRHAASEELASCLKTSGVHNFSIASLTENFPVNDHILKFSIQNRRFFRSSLLSPAAVILPHDLHSLRSSILCCRGSSFAIRLRSGGHSYEGLSYASSGDGPFALVDLMNLHRIDVNTTDRTAWLQSGATLGQLYHAISTASEENRPLGFSAGSCPTVGSGGHIAGGGFGLLSRMHGLAADHVVDAVIVTPDGRVLDRGGMGEDLFWAIRGGGGGTWGAVYDWKVRLQAVPHRVAAFIVNRSGSNRHIAELIEAWQWVAPDLPDEFYLSCFVGGSLPESVRTGISATFKGLYLGSSEEARSILSDQFPGLKLREEEVKEMSWIESIVFFSGMKKGSTVHDLLDRKLHMKTFFKAKSDYVRARISLPDLIRAVDLLSTEPKAYLIIDPYGGAMNRRRADEIPFPHRSGTLYGIQHLIEWMDDDDEGIEGYMQWIREWYEFMGPLVSSGPRAAYVNYLDLDLGRNGDAVEAKVWGEKYFLGNYERLVQVKTAVDPNNVFRHEQSIPPLATSVGFAGCSEAS
ncbi:hypothetical protein HPP92_025119 [Vanilla planifolia]|uniref:FAD-binding PCMH-type domain-containing protein n=1 Tax=Vanilla planifolia TaxID=51239 RepID=A0A835PHA2_VANPL|nr:hypothetical protein HPP92_025119 [Vanilla planifolia]